MEVQDLQLYLFVHENKDTLETKLDVLHFCI